MIKSNMNKTLRRSALAGLLILTASAVFARDTFYVYRDFHSRDNHYAPSGWMGDYGDIRLNDRYQPANDKSVKPVIQITYTGEAKQGNNWAGIYWQNPANNWGSRPGGYNLNGRMKFSFKARGENGGERIEEFKIGGLSGDYADSGSASVGPVILTKEWKTYTMSLDGIELSSISGGFCWTANRDGNPEGATFYLDDIKYE